MSNEPAEEFFVKLMKWKGDLEAAITNYIENDGPLKPVDDLLKWDPNEDEAKSE